MKKVFIVLGVLVALVVAALVVLPMLYPIDQLRPQIQKAAEAKVRGKVEIGKLSLTGFPSLRVNIDGITLRSPAPFDGEPLARLPSVKIEMPLLSLFTSPRVVVHASDAQIKIFSRLEKNGLAKSSLTEFLPPTESLEQKKTEALEAAKGPGLGGSLAALPGFIATRVARARVSVELDHTNVLLESVDNPKTDSVALKELSFGLENVGLSTPIALHFDTQTTGIKGAAVFNGQIKGEGTAKFTPSGKNNLIDLDVKTDLSGLEVKAAPLFHKPAGTEMAVVLKGHVNVSPLVTTIDLERFDLHFNEATAGGPLKMTSYVAEPEKNDVSLEIKADKIELKPFGAFIPMVRDFKLAGDLGIDLSVKGFVSDPGFKILITLAHVQGATPQLQKPVTDLHGTISVSGTAKNPSVVIEPFALKVGASDIAFHLDEKGLDAPSVNIRVVSKRLDADELLGAPAAEKGKSGGATSPAAPVAAQPLDDKLNQMAPAIEEALKNPMLDKVHATMALDFKSIRFLGAEYTDALLNVGYAARQLKISKTGLGAYGGRVSLESTFGLDPKAPTYDVHAGLTGVKIQEATKVHAPAWKDELTGSLNGELKLNGRGLRKEQLAANLGGGLSGEIKDGRLNVPVVQILSKIVSSIPAVAGKKFDLPGKGQEFKGEFKTMKLTTNIKGRVVQLQNLDVDYDSQKAGLGEMRFQSTGTVTFDRALDITGTAFLSPEIVRIAELKGPSGKIEIPLKLKGDMSNPTPDIGYSLKILGPRVAQGALKGQAGKAAFKALDQIQAPPAVKQQLQNLKKKFGF